MFSKEDRQPIFSRTIRPNEDPGQVMQEAPPYAYDQALASQVQPLLEKMVSSALLACASSYEK